LFLVEGFFVMKVGFVCRNSFSNPVNICCCWHFQVNIYIYAYILLCDHHTWHKHFFR
jgi:hypothetical protein